MTTKKQAKVEGLKERATKYAQGEAALLKQLHLNRACYIHFPSQSTVPLVARVAIKLLNLYGGQLNIRISDALPFQSNG